MSAASSGKQLQLPASLETQLLEFRRRVWTIKSIEAAGGAVFGVGLGFLAVYLLDRTIVLFGSGRLMAVFVVYFLAVTALGVAWIRRAHQGALTPSTRRRLSYLSTSFMAPNRRA